MQESISAKLKRRKVGCLHTTGEFSGMVFSITGEDLNDSYTEMIGYSKSHGHFCQFCLIVGLTLSEHCTKIIITRSF